MATQKEVLQILLQVTGEEEARELAKAFDQLEQSGEEGAASAKKLIDQINRLSEAKKAANSLGSLKAQLSETTRELEEAEAGLVSLNAQFSASDRSSKEVSRAFRQAADAVSDLQNKQRTLTLDLQRAEGALGRAEVNTKDLTRETDRLGREIAETATQIRTQGAAAAASATQQDRLTNSAQRGISVFDRLKGAIAGFIAAIGIRELAQGAAAILGLGEAADKADRQFARLFGGRTEGAAAMDALRKLASDLGQDFNLLRENAAKLKTFGLDPLDGSLQALIDQNTAAGGSNEDLAGKILAVGQAWSKQKLQGEEILQLVERGIPVWDLLAKATGKNVPELQKLSEAGKLGRTEIKLLLAEIGKANSGAAAEALEGLTARLTVLQNTLREIGEDFARNGPTDALADSLGRVTKELNELANSPEFDRLKGSLTGVFEEGLEAAEAFLNSERFRVAAADIAGSIDSIRLAVQLLNTEISGDTSAIDLFLKLGEAANTPIRLINLLAADVSRKLNPAMTEGKVAAEGLAGGLGEVKKEAEGMNPVIAAFQAMWEGFKKVTTDTSKIVSQAFKDIGVDAQNSGVEVTDAGKKIIAALGFLAGQAQVTGQQFRAAFTKALDSAETVVEVQKMEAALKAAFDNGKISAAEYARGALAAAEKTREIKTAADEAAGGLTAIGDAAEREARRAIAAMEATRSSIAGTAATIAAELAKAIESQAPREEINRLKEALAAAEAQAGEFTKKIDAANAALEKTGQTGTQAAEQITQGAQAATEATQETAAAAEQTGTAIGGILGQLVAMYQKFVAVSPAAAEFFKDSYNGAVQLAVTLGDVAQAIARAELATDAAIASQLAGAANLQQQFDAVAEAGEGAGLAFQQASVLGIEGLRDFAQVVRDGGAQLDLLNQADLEKLAGSIDRAAQKLQQLKAQAQAATDELAAMNRQLQDEADAAAGNRAAILEREHQDRLRKIEELARTAGAAGAAAADEARRRAEEAYRRELELLRLRTQAERESANSSPPPRPGSGGGSGGNSTGGGTVISPTVNVGSPVVIGTLTNAQANNLAGQLQRPIEQTLQGIVRRSR